MNLPSAAGQIAQRNQRLLRDLGQTWANRPESGRLSHRIEAVRRALGPAARLPEVVESPSPRSGARRQKVCVSSEARAGGVPRIALNTTKTRRFVGETVMKSAQRRRALNFCQAISDGLFVAQVVKLGSWPFRLRDRLPFTRSVEMHRAGAQGEVLQFQNRPTAQAAGNH